MEDILKSDIKDTEDLKHIVKKMKNYHYDAFINDPKKKDFVFSQLELYKINEKNINEQEKILENMKKQRFNIEKSIYLTTDLYVKDIKEFLHDE